MSVAVPVIDHIDGVARRIYLKVGVVSYHPVDDIYVEARRLRAITEALQNYDNFVSAGGNVKKLADGSKRTSRYAIFNMCKVVPWDSNHSLAITGEQLYTDTIDGEPIGSGSLCVDKTLLSPGVAVNIDYAPPDTEVIVVATGSGVTEQDKVDIITGVLTADNTGNDDSNTVGGAVVHLKHLNYTLFVDTAAALAGDGSQHAPFKTLTAAIDFAEVHGIFDIVLLSDTTLDRSLNSFRFTGIGNPTVNTNGKSLSKVEFFHCNMMGAYGGGITVQQGVLLDGFRLSGYFEKCALAGDLTCVGGDGGDVILAGCFSGIPGTGRPTISMGIGVESYISVRDYTGGLTIKDCNSAGDVITVDGRGALTCDSSCTAGEMVARGRWEPFVNNANGASVYPPVGDQSKVDDIHAADYNHRSEGDTTMTIYEDDLVTPKRVFDIIRDANGLVIDITPQ